MDFCGARLDEILGLIRKIARDGERADHGRRIALAVGGIELNIRAIKGRITLIGNGWAVSFVGSPRSIPKNGVPPSGSKILIGDQLFHLHDPSSVIGEAAFKHQMALVRLFGSEWDIE